MAWVVASAVARSCGPEVGEAAVSTKDGALDQFGKKCRRRQNRRRGFRPGCSFSEIAAQARGGSRDDQSQQVLAGGHNQAELEAALDAGWLMAASRSKGKATKPRPLVGASRERSDQPGTIAVALTVAAGTGAAPRGAWPR